jgi:uncharacterized protein (DUF427 family)
MLSIDNHPIRITPTKERIQVLLSDTVLANSSRALTLSEADYKPVLYIPRSDVRMDLLERTEHTTRCPYKGLANYFTIKLPGLVRENAAWSYETPNPVAAPIAGYVSFYPDQVTIEVGRK